MTLLRRLITVGVGGCVLGYSSNVFNVPLRAKSSSPAEKDSHEEPDVRDLTLKSVQVFFRHGARTPLKHVPGLQEVTYDKNKLIKSVHYTEIPYTVEYLHGGPAPVSRLEDVYAKTSFQGGVIAGMLTVTGKDQAFQLGQRLAKRYRHEHKLIGSEFSPSDIFIRATNIQRCIDSLQCVVAGLFGVESFKQVDNPVVIRVDKAEDEMLYPNFFSCPMLRVMSKYSQQQLSNRKEFIDLVREIQKHTGDSTPPHEFDMMQMRDHIVARKAHGLAVPAFLEELSDKIDQAAVDAMLFYICAVVSDWCTLGQKCTPREASPAFQSFHGCQLDLKSTGITLAMGRTLHMIVETMKNSVYQQSDRQRTTPKMYLYSCHDTSLVPLLIAIGCFDNRWPPYSADITFELYEDAKQKQWIKVLYCGKEMTLVGCSRALIPFERFYSIIKDFCVAPKDYGDLCKIAADRFPQFTEIPSAKFD